MPVLDTSFLIDLNDRHPAAVQALAAIKDQRLAVPYQAALEFLSGANDPLTALQRLQAGFRLVFPDENFLLAGAALRANERRRGRRPRWGDLNIALVAQLEDDFVVTANKSDYIALGVPAWDYRHEDAPPDPSP